MATWLAMAALAGLFASLTLAIRWARSRKRALVYLNGLLLEPGTRPGARDYGWDFPADPLPVFHFDISVGSNPDKLTIVWPGGRRVHYWATHDDQVGFIWVKPKDWKPPPKKRNRRRGR